MKRLILLAALLAFFLFLPDFIPDYEIGNREFSGQIAAHAEPEGTLLLNEISPWPSNGNPWVEIINPGGGGVTVAGWTIEFVSGYSFTFPSNAPVIPSNGLHLLDITGNPLNASGDGCILTSPDGVAKDIITWGNPEFTDRLPLAPGAPLMPYLAVRHDDTIHQSDDVVFRIPDTWDLPGTSHVGSDYWAYRSASAATKGAENHFPGPSVFSPPDGSLIASAIHLAVLDMDFSRQITFQVALDAEFTDIVHTETTGEGGIEIETLPAGTYYWRVSTEGTGDWSIYQSFTVLGINLDEILSQNSTSQNHADITRYLADAKSGGDAVSEIMLFGNSEIASSHVIGITRLVQGKDTDMVCFDGCRMLGEGAWDSPHHTHQFHGRMYCVRACLAMIASSYGCTLSQDRITYYIFQEAGSQNRDGQETGELDNPFKDLGHNLGAYDNTTCFCLDWIYNQPAGSAREIAASASNWDDNDATDMDTVREFLDDGRPVVRNLEHHATLIDGYAIIRDNDAGTETIMVHVLDPARSGGASWLDFPGSEVYSYILPPANGIPMRCDEPEVSMDSDGDQLVDFDETERFGTDPHMYDSDDDGLDDMTDMQGYLFNPDGSYNCIPGYRDYDNDGVAKELDPDSDHPENNGVEDGCEDFNLDGFFNDDGTETDNFLMSDDFDVISRYCYNGFIRWNSTVGGIPAFPAAVFKVEEIITIENGQPTSSRQYIYDMWWQLTAEGFVLPMFGGEIRCMVEGYGDARASIQIEVQPNGHYRMVTDSDPRVVQYTIITTAPGMAERRTTQDFHLGAANHHYGYVSPEAPPIVDVMQEAAGRPNVFEGQVVRDPDGGVRVAGNDIFDSTAFIESPGGTLERTWEIWIERPD